MAEVLNIGGQEFKKRSPLGAWGLLFLTVFSVALMLKLLVALRVIVCLPGLRLSRTNRSPLPRSPCMSGSRTPW